MSEPNKAARLAARRGMFRTADRIEAAEGWAGVVFRPEKRDPVLIADAHTSMCDYRIALAQALGRPCDRNGFVSSPAAGAADSPSAGVGPGGVEAAPPPGRTLGVSA